MSNPIKDEFQCFKKLFLNYGKVIFGGMLLSGMFLFFYEGIKANYVFITLLTAIVSTLSLSLVVLFLYFRFHETREKTRIDKHSIREALTERTRADDEELRRLIVETIAGLRSSENKTSQKSTLLVSVFQWGNLIGKMFYYGLTMVKLDSSFGKGPRKV